jgi:hypothetical protein
VIRKFLKSIFYLLAGFSLLLLAWFGYLLVAAGAPPEDPMVRKGQLAEVQQVNEYTLRGNLVREFRLRSDTGLEVELAVRYPDRQHEDRPLMLMMGGQETGRAAVDVIPDTHGVIVAAISYPFGIVPHRSGLDMLLSLRRIQEGIFDTPAVALLALDYLLGPESGLAPGRVELAGISFGAYLAALPAALDDRVERLWLIHGGAAVPQVLDHGLRKRISSDLLRRQVANYLATVAGAQHLSSEHWVGRVSPRPLVLVHARADRDLPDVAIEALRGAASEPFEVLWTPGEHVHPKRPEVVKAITDLMFDRIVRTAPVGAPTGQN